MLADELDTKIDIPYTHALSLSYYNEKLLGTVQCK